MRTLQVGENPTRLAQGIAEFGRIDKTLHSLRFIDDKDMRRGTLTQLNRGEGRHSVARVVFSGKRGELRQRYREGPGRSTRRARARRQYDRCSGIQFTWRHRSGLPRFSVQLLLKPRH